MIQSKEDLHLCLKYEKEIYSQYMFPTKLRYILSRLKREPIRIIYLFMKYSRITDYYHMKTFDSSLLYKLLYFYYVSKKHRLGERLGLEVDTTNIKEGLLIYHYNNVVNGGSVIGKNCHLHGNNCIGNNGKTNECPIIGDNVMLGVGAKVLGNITIASNIKIAAGAVVVHSFEEEGITIGGIPAKKIN
jgi:serine O-acetyltransferase